MYKVPIPILERALKNQEKELSILLLSPYTGLVLRSSMKSRKRNLKKSISELKSILGEE